VYVSPFSIPLVVVNGAFVVALAWHARASKALESRRDAVLLAMAFAVSALATPFILKFAGTTDAGEDLLYNIGTIFFGAVLATLVITVARNHFICKKKPEQKARLSYEGFLAALPTGDEKRRDNSRKILHCVISVAPIIVYAICINADAYFKSAGIMQEYGVTGLVAGRGVNLIIYWGFSYMATMEDLARLNAFHLIPGWGRTWLRTSLEAKEHRTFTAAVPFLIGHVPLLLAPLPAFFSTSFVASIGDAAGSVFGKRFGKHKLPGGTKKSWEGLAAEMLVSFTAVLVVNLAFDPVGWIAAIVMAAAVAGCAGLFDAKVTRVDDNYMNTFALGAIAWVLYLLLHA
jgi:CDP-diglyceride synthetase